MWTIKITKIIKNKVSFDVTYQILKDGVIYETDILTSVTPVSSVYSFLQTRIALAKSVDAFDPATVIGDVDLNNLPPPSAEDIYLQKRTELLQVKNDFDLKLASQQDLDTKTAEVLAIKP